MDADGPELGELTCDALTAGIEVFQRARGHRFSSDDTVTAWAAMQVCPAPRRVLDLGCGLGSVLLHIAWSAPGCTLVGVEAQEISFELLRRNIAHNRLGHRIEVHHGDLRDREVQDRLGGPFDLITGTPPYFPPSAASDAIDEQRAFARIEYRGGIEAYIEAGSARLAPNGRMVLCGDADAEHRTHAAAGEHGLQVTRRHVVTPRAGRAPLFTVWVLGHRATVASGDVDDVALVLRDEHGAPTSDARMMRAFSGFAPRSATAAGPPDA